MLRTILRWAAILATAIAAAAAGSLLLRASAQARNGAAAEIHSPEGVQEAGFVRVNGTEEWVTIRGQDRANPILMVIDGGPGFSTSHLVPHPLEDVFTIVKWDQPGAGRSFGRAGRRIDPTLTEDRFAADGIAVAEHARRRLGGQRVGLLATSWGTGVALRMVQQRPDLFYAYVGAGQVVDGRRGEAIGYRQVLAKALARGDRRAIAELQQIGPPPYEDNDELRVQRKWAMAYEAGAPSGTQIAMDVLTAPGFSLSDARNWFDGFLQGTAWFYEMRRDRAMAELGTCFRTPVFLFQGDQDDFTPYGPAREYFEQIEAPVKRFWTVRGAGHFAVSSHRRELRQRLVEEVRPLALAPARTWECAGGGADQSGPSSAGEARRTPPRRAAPGPAPA